LQDDATARGAPAKWPTALLAHPAVCEDPAVLLRLLATGRGPPAREARL
jgi:hypothetical protein